MNLLPPSPCVRCRNAINILNSFKTFAHDEAVSLTFLYTPDDEHFNVIVLASGIFACIMQMWCCVNGYFQDDCSSNLFIHFFVKHALE